MICTPSTEPRLRLESRFWGGEGPYRLKHLGFAPVATLRPLDGDVYTREHDLTVWLYHTVWYGPFDEIEAAETAARMMQ